MLEFPNKYVSSVIDNALVFSNHTNNKKTVDANDVALALSNQQYKNLIRTPEKERYRTLGKILGEPTPLATNRKKRQARTRWWQRNIAG
ncbi:hypothetical protein TNCV_3368821 [Trichonephila clavipes]|uniref:Uncharacterized protein n=1 Tax=Trichonephila clavipes TaxID=2585209 RepID=A0A8X6RCX1_TRICX|nr:hypothetical protein TNCV_3368821 [Trichonephila clavipes]